MKKWWRQNSNILFFVVLLFLTSNLFVHGFASLAVSEFGAKGASFADFCIWDCPWYSSIIDEGYFIEPKGHEKGDAANWAFFPAFPIIAMIVKNIFGVATHIALVLTSKLFLLLGLFAFMKLVEHELGGKYVFLAGILVAFNPYIIYAHAGYTETLYFFFSASAFLALKRKQWIIAGLAGGLMSATRVVGVLFTFVYVIRLLPELRHFGDLEKISRYLLGLLLLPLGMSLYMVYLQFHTGDAMAFSHIQVAWGRSLQNPFSNLWIGLTTGSAVKAIFALLALIMAAWLLFKKYYHYGLFLLLTTLLPLSTGLESLPRYVMWQVPFLFGLVLLLSKREAIAWIGGFYATGIASFITLAWFTGKGFVI